MEGTLQTLEKRMGKKEAGVEPLLQGILMQNQEEREEVLRVCRRKGWKREGDNRRIGK